MTLHGPRYFAQLLMGLQQNMNVIRHDNPSKELVQFPLVGRSKQRLNHAIGDSGIFEPCWALRGSVHFAIERDEPTTFGHPLGLPPFEPARQGAKQPPSQKDWFAFRMPVR